MNEDNTTYNQTITKEDAISVLNSLRNEKNQKSVNEYINKISSIDDISFQQEIEKNNIKTIDDVRKFFKERLIEEIEFEMEDIEQIQDERQESVKNEKIEQNDDIVNENIFRNNNEKVIAIDEENEKTKLDIENNSKGQKLLESINCEKGITLNSQLVDLMLILEENIPLEEQNNRINEYINNLADIQEKYKEVCEKGGIEQYKFVIDKVVESIDEIPEKSKEQIKQIYLSSAIDNSLFDVNKMEHKLMDNNIDYNINSLIQKRAKSFDFVAKEGILDLTPNKVRKLYSHMFTRDGNTYDRITIDMAGKYSGCVGLDGETFANEDLDKMIKFAEQHHMKSKINALVFYDDFPTRLEQSLQKQADEKGMTEQAKREYVKEKIKDSLEGYVRNIARNYGDKIETVDIFNELIYDPQMTEDVGKFGERDDFHYREKGWQEYLSLEDLCDVALMARKEMPNVTFTYNDMNWVNPEKRKEIINVVNKIQTIEQKYRKEGKLAKNERGLIETIGLEAHLTSNVNLEEIDRTFDDIKKYIGLDVEVTELDVARFSNSPQEISKQNKVFQKFRNLAQERTEFRGLTIWSQSDECSFLNEKCGKNVHASLLDENFEEKDIDRVISQEKQYSTPQYTITPNQIGKKSVYTHIGKKDIARGVVDRKVEERTHPQELDPHAHTHNGSQGGSGDGR